LVKNAKQDIGISTISSQRRL